MAPRKGISERLGTVADLTSSSEFGTFSSLASFLPSEKPPTDTAGPTKKASTSQSDEPLMVQTRDPTSVDRRQPQRVFGDGRTEGS